MSYQDLATEPTAGGRRLTAGVCLTIQGGEEATAIYSNTTRPAHSGEEEELCVSVGSSQPATTTSNNHLDTGETYDTSGYITLTCDDGYLKTLPGFVRFLLIISSVISLLCLLTSGGGDVSYTDLPVASEIRINIFILVFSFLIIFLILFLHVSTLDQYFLLNWNTLNLVLFSVLFFMYAVAATLLTYGVAVHHEFYKDIKEWTYEQLVISVVLNFLCVLFCSYVIYHAYRVYKGYDLYNRQRLHEISTVSS